MCSISCLVRLDEVRFEIIFSVVSVFSSCGVVVMKFICRLGEIVLEKLFRVVMCCSWFRLVRLGWKLGFRLV